MSIEVEINKNLLSEVDVLSKKLHMNRSQLISAALKRYLHLQQMKFIRNELKGVARKRGFRSERDVFNAIS